MEIYTKLAEEEEKEEALKFSEYMDYSITAQGTDVQKMKASA